MRAVAADRRASAIITASDSTTPPLRSRLRSMFSGFTTSAAEQPLRQSASCAPISRQTSRREAPGRLALAVIVLPLGVDVVEHRGRRARAAAGPSSTTEPEATGLSLCGIAELPTLPSTNSVTSSSSRQLQVVDVLGDLAERRREHGQQQEELREAVAGGLGRDRAGRRVRAAASAALCTRRPLRPSAASVPTAPPNSPTSTRAPALQQPLALAQQLVQPDRAP